MTEAMPLTRRLRRVAPLALVVVVVAACGDNDKSSAAPNLCLRDTTTRPPDTRATPAIGGGTKPRGRRSL